MRKSVAVGLLVASSASTLFAHGVQVQITFNQSSGEIETREIVHTGSRPSSLTDLKRVYVMPLLPIIGGAGDGWYTRPAQEVNHLGIPLHPSGPGITWQYDEAGQLPGTGWSYSGSGTLPNLQNTNFGYSFADQLREWNGSVFIDPGVEQGQVMRSDGISTPTGTANTSDGAGPYASMALGNIGSKSSNAHTSISYKLLGDGVNSSVGGAADGDNGIYLLSLQLTSTAAGVGASDPFYYVMYKNRSVEDAMTAAQALGFSPSLIQVVPEPGAIVGLTGALLLAARRRKS
jgi:hypothetical protein